MIRKEKFRKFFQTLNLDQHFPDVFKYAAC